MKNNRTRIRTATLAILGSILGLAPSSIGPVGSQLAARGGDAAQFGPNSSGALRTAAAAAKTPSTGLQIAALLSSGGGGVFGGAGCPPDVWGRSNACARMRRKNRMVALGIKRSRI